MQRPSDRSEGCECYQISFAICHHLTVHRVTMCREWARYMAGHYVINGMCRSNEAWSKVVEEEVRKAYPVSSIRPPRQWEIKSPTVRKLIEPLGYFPSYFSETVMDNRYGTISNAIPLAEIASKHFIDLDDANVATLHEYKDRWSGIYGRVDADVMDRNKAELRRFKRVLDRIAGHGKAIASMKESMKKAYTTKEDFAAVMLHITASEQHKQQTL